ncbi:MAG: hypothetical protein FJ098_01090 [Deltaproteobacteria bacterium]|nr:hypothetical protein [Deltaproteobacteria bacterium]
MNVRSLVLRTLLALSLVAVTGCPSPGPVGGAEDTIEPDAGPELPGGDGETDAPCVPDCTGLACGPDPVCGTECGGCDPGFACEEGQCACIPDCAGLECGPDPACGEECGPCGDGEVCDAGTCVPGDCPPEETCADLGLECGPHPECPELSCGECDEGWVCEEGTCEEEVCTECCLECEDNGDCEDTFTPAQLGACHESRCIWDGECAAFQCAMVPVEDALCCDSLEDCPPAGLCATATCILNQCTYSKKEDCCAAVPEVLYSMTFNDLEEGAEPSPLLFSIQDGDVLDSVAWTAQQDPCDPDGMALYLGDPWCMTYDNGALWDCAPVTEIGCVSDQDCPPGSTCLTEDGTNLCSGEPSSPIVFEASVPAEEVVLPPDAFVALFYTVRTDLEPASEGFSFDTLKLFVEYTPDPDGDPVEVPVHTAPQSTDGDCVTFAADLSTFAPVTAPGSPGGEVAARPVKLIWRFDTLDGENNYFPGLWLDDIRVETYCDNCFGNVNCEDQNVCTVDQCIVPPVFGGNDGLCDNAEVFDACVPCPGGPSDCAPSAPPGTVWTCAPEGYCLYVPDPDLCIPPEEGTGILLDEGLEEGDVPDAWTVETPVPAGSDVTWQVTNASACDGSYALYFGNGTDYDCGQALCSGAVTTPEIDLEDVEDLYDLRLSFCARLSTEWDTVEPGAYPVDNAHTLQIDVLYVEVLTGAIVTEVWNSDAVAGTTQGLWKDAWASLSPFKGQTIRLRFRFHTGTATPANNDHPGVFVDGIRIEKVCGAVCGTAADCTAGGACTDAVCDFGACSYPQDPECCTVQINPACDDGNPCTNDSCTLATQTCKHTFTGNPQCCNPNPSVWTDSFLSILNSAWHVPPAGATCGVFPFECEDILGESCMNCPSDCGPCPVSWNVTTAQSFTAPFALHFGNPETGTYANGQEPAQGFIASPDVLLPPYGIPAASFHLWLDTEHTSVWWLFEQKVDWDILRLHVQVKTGSSYGSQLEVWNSQAWDFKGSTFDGVADDVVWKTVYVGLDGMNLAGKTVRFVLEFDSFDDSNNDYAGAFVDDFKVFTLCDEAFECLSGYDCAETSPLSPDCSMELCDGADGADASGGTCIAEPNPFLAGCCIQNPVGVMQSDFDGPCGLEGWVASPTAGQTPVAWQTWNEENKTPGGQCALYFGNPATAGYDNPGQVPEGTVTSPTWAIPTGLDATVDVSFWLWMDLEDTWSLTDKLTLSMGLKFFSTLPPDKVVTVWDKPCDQALGLCTDPVFQEYCDAWGCTNWPWGQWKHVTVTIPTAQFQGYSHLNFWFTFDTMDSIANDGVGVFVDDFEVTTSCQ